MTDLHFTALGGNDEACKQLAQAMKNAVACDQSPIFQYDHFTITGEKGEVTQVRCHYRAPQYNALSQLAESFE